MPRNTMVRRSAACANATADCKQDGDSQPGILQRISDAVNKGESGPSIFLHTVHLVVQTVIL